MEARETTQASSNDTCTTSRGGLTTGSTTTSGEKIWCEKHYLVMWEIVNNRLYSNIRDTGTPSLTTCTLYYLFCSTNITHSFEIEVIFRVLLFWNINIAPRQERNLFPCVLSAIKHRTRNIFKTFLQSACNDAYLCISVCSIVFSCAFRCQATPPVRAQKFQQSHPLLDHLEFLEPLEHLKLLKLWWTTTGLSLMDR